MEAEQRIEGLAPPPPEPLVAHEVMPRRFKDWVVSDRELSTLGFISVLGTGAGVFLGIFVGAAVSLGTTLRTVDIPAGKTYLWLVAAFISSVALTLICLVLFAVTLYWSYIDVAQIKSESEQEQRRRELLAES